MSKTESSPLAQSVLALDGYLADLERIGAKIGESSMKTEFDLAQIRRLMARFAECGQGVSDEVTNLSRHLNEARARAEKIAEGVALRAAELETLNDAAQDKWDRFRALNDKVRDLNSTIASLRQPEGVVISEEQRHEMTASLGRVDAQLDPLIEEAQIILREARASSIRTLEQNADSLAQSLIAVRSKIRGLPAPVTH